MFRAYMQFLGLREDPRFNRETAFKSEIFREVLRPNDGLRMTEHVVFRKGKQQFEV